MKKPVIVYYEILKYQPENLRLLSDNFRIISLPDPNAGTLKILGQADVVLAPLGYYFGKEKIDLASKLKVIASNTTGHPHIDADYAGKKGVKVITLKKYKEFLQKITPTAELTWGLIIALTRNMITAYRSVLEGRWDRRPFGASSMLSRMNLGIAGYGRLGKMVGRYGRSFGMAVRYYDPFVSSATGGIKRVNSLRELIKSSDIVTIHIPHNPGTENLFDRKTFSGFKKGSYLINTSRGELIDHEALLKCLEDGTLAGAALDVFEGEFKSDFSGILKKHPLIKYAGKHANLIITPH
ncbi:MAG: NAD(P)-dependent oxidoreductase, partial [Candidatus Omnitrophota bacterium]|nr:NAD(P)-dependent oxidoreductase [Candidatus Omnitrophota bacterium]